jgi:hypothetical protein
LRRKALLVSAIALAIAAASMAHAGEPRPWLCRDKPVFSSQQPMSYRLSTNSQWQLFLMQFTPGAGHDGFDITKTIRGSSNGHLPAGRYFAVALHTARGNWVCPAEADEQPRAAGTISNLCFAAQEGDCSVKFVVTSDRAASSAP